MENDSYNVTASRLAFAIIAIVGCSSCAVFLHGYVTKQAWIGEPLGAIAMMVFLGGLGAVMAYAAIRPPVPLALDGEGARFRTPPVTVLWKDVKEAHVSTQGMKTVVELVVVDIDKYLSQLSKSQRKTLDYEIDSGALRFSFIASGKIDRIRSEIDARLTALPEGAAHATPTDTIETPEDSFVFNARYLATISSDRLYRVCCANGTFYMIRIGGQADMDVLCSQFGAIGALFAGLLRRGARTPEDIATMDEKPPESLLDNHKHNFKFTAHEVMQASIDPASAIQSHGAHVGRMSLVLADGKKWKFQFEEVRHMRCAVTNLPAVLGPLLAVNVQWDESKKAYVYAPETINKA